MSDGRNVVRKLLAAGVCEKYSWLERAGNDGRVYARSKRVLELSVELDPRCGGLVNPA